MEVDGQSGGSKPFVVIAPPEELARDTRAVAPPSPSGVDSPKNPSRKEWRGKTIEQKLDLIFSTVTSIFDWVKEQQDEDYEEDDYDDPIEHIPSPIKTRKGKQEKPAYQTQPFWEEDPDKPVYPGKLPYYWKSQSKY